MAYSRREIAPADQIKALRHARDHYVQLADRIHNEPESALSAVEKQLREDDARRIAKAYDRSLSNNVDRMSRMEGTHKSTSRSFKLWYLFGALLIPALACLGSFAYMNTPALNRFLNLRGFGPVVLNPVNEMPRAGIQPPVVLQQEPLPQEPEAPKALEPGLPEPPAALAVPAPGKIVPPRSPAAKAAAPRKTANDKPAVIKQATPKPPETAIAATPAPALLMPPTPAPTIAPAPLPAPAERPAPPAALAAPSPTAIAPAPPAIKPEPIAQTHTLPRYPPLSARAGETGTTRMSVAISPQGQASDCRITQSSGSERLDSAACAHVTDHWRWKPVSRDITTPAPRVSVTMVWNLSRPSRGR